MSVPVLKSMKSKKKITMITCYDYTFAKILNTTRVDCVLVGDSLATTIYGHPNTIPATVDMMALHIGAVAKGAPNKFIVGDLPFCSYRKSLSKNMSAMETLMRAGAQALKLEGAEGNLALIRHAVASGIPIVGHLGLMPQSVFCYGGFKVQAKEKMQQEKILQEALQLEEAGAFMLVLECIPADLAAEITQRLSIPTIGIGAGNKTDGQVLVLQDLLGLSTGHSPKFVKKFMDGHASALQAFNAYIDEVESSIYPDASLHTYEGSQ